jgi:(E)-4-hydroxy-3-methyl-but-2-enyl pyrophosphate reductase
MSVKLAETAGFCMGVKRAVDMVLDIAQRKGKENIYTYGPLIHNPQTVEIMMKRGIIPIQDIAEINATDTGATIIIRAHGISPQERKKIKEKGIRIVDATCPKVAHVQAIIRKHASQDYAVIIVGDADHPEVNGLLGHAHGKGIVIGSVNDVDRLPPLEKVCVVAQTTQNMDEFNEIVNRTRERFSDTVIFNTICDSTEKRQAEVKRLAAETDAVFIIGGRNSANTRRLATISELQGKPTFHIETAEELNQISIRGFERVGVSAGASTPNWIIDRHRGGTKRKGGKSQMAFKILGLHGENGHVFFRRCGMSFSGKRPSAESPCKFPEYFDHILLCVCHAHPQSTHQQKIQYHYRIIQGRILSKA